GHRTCQRIRDRGRDIARNNVICCIEGHCLLQVARLQPRPKPHECYCSRCQDAPHRHWPPPQACCREPCLRRGTEIRDAWLSRRWRCTAKAPAEPFSAPAVAFREATNVWHTLHHPLCELSRLAAA